MSRYLIALSLAAIVTGGLPALHSARAAELPGDRPAEAVQIYAAELLSTTGIARVHERLENAARDVCHGFDSRDVERQMRYRRCVAEALERAVRDVHDARLSAYHQAKAGAVRTAAAVTRTPASAHTRSARAAERRG